MPLKRPPDTARTRWENLQRTKGAKERAEQTRVERAREGQHLESGDFAPAWSEPEWVDAIVSAQHGLCGWCTRNPVDGGDTGQIDHIRPKTSVHRDVEETGEEHGARKQLKGRRCLPEDGLRPGYYWRAYDPENFIYSCGRCNIAWKRTLWPVDPWHDSAQWRAPAPGETEVELVLDPFAEDFQPADHFMFGEFGAIAPRADDERAAATIVALGLDRPCLCDARWNIERDLETYLKHLRRLRDPQDDQDERELVQVVEKLRRQCEWSSSHAAFFQAIMGRLMRHLEIDEAILTRSGAEFPKLRGWADES